ncbi:YXWGXW repeat-containing protein [Burkholderia guangdongensis]|uniref:YXWGXW repeat-containing protein n=1 Tax=Burkholderia guangdongensis TaxID=1792500 RepID=UPI0015CC75B8|nr:YXWGXW repeat-containing protein [Burkholderia guangdongensis]
MNRRSLLRALGLTAVAAVAGIGGGLRPAAAQPPAPGYPPPGPPGRPPFGDRPGIAPPALRRERRPSPPRPHGFIWTDGYWSWQRGRYVWIPGRWIARRPGRRWVPGYWRRQGPAWVYVDGSWR